MLGEFADLVQLGARELSGLWQAQDLRSTSHSPTRKTTDAAPSRRWVRSTPARSGSMPGRQQPASRADHAARLMLSHPASWEVFSAEDHAMLCALPPPHGPLFVWLEQQLHDHGAQPWGAMREGLRDHPSEELAQRLMAVSDMAGTAETADSSSELRNLITRMLMDHLKQQETQAIAESRTDPDALRRYRSLQLRRLELEAALQKPV